MAQARGEKFQNAHLRIAPAIETQALLQATAADSQYHAPGTVVMVEDGSLWWFDADSTASASATVIVPDNGSGRWHNVVPAGGASAGSSYKFPVRLATNAALAAYTRVGNVITADANGALGNIDGVAAALSDRVLLTSAGTASDVDNGLYVVSDLGSGSTPWVLTRADDANEDGEIVGGMLVPVQDGTNDGGEIYLCTNAAGVTINTTAITFALVPSTQDLGSTATGLGASLIGTEDAGTYYSTATVEGNLQEAGASLAALSVGTISFGLHDAVIINGTGGPGSLAGDHGGRLASDSAPALEGDANQALQLIWDAGDIETIAYDVSVPADYDGSGDITVRAQVSSNTTDPATFTLRTSWDGGVLVVDTITDGAQSATRHETTATIDNGDIPANPKTLTVQLTPAAHATDPIRLHGFRFEYPR
jgi:hypothetical protein